MPINSAIKKVRVALVGRTGKMGQALHELINSDPSVELSETADVVIDFSSPEGTVTAIEKGLPLVCGTTGLSKEILSMMEQLSHTVPVLYASNFSLGACLLFELLKDWGPLLKNHASVSIEETHSQQKLDRPSGTALKLGGILDCEAITSHRVEEDKIENQVNFLFGDETLSFKHEAFSRTIFARGALMAAKSIFWRGAKLYTMRDILIENNQMVVDN